MTKRPEISVVIPAYNEESRIGASLEVIRDFFTGKLDYWEVIVVDDGSDDKTEEKVMRFVRETYGIRIIKLGKNIGKGKAVKEGVLAAKGKTILITDADLAAPFEEMNKLKARLDEGFDGVVGVRTGPGSNVQRTFLRGISGKIFNYIVRSLILPDFTDTQCGFKMFKAEAAHDIFKLQVMDGFSFDIEILYLAVKKNYRIEEVPVNWSAKAGSKVKLFSDAFRMIRDIFRIKKIHR